VSWKLPIGATYTGRGTHFRVWAANARQMAVQLYMGEQAEQVVATHALQPEGEGYFAGEIPGVAPGTRYMYRIDGGDARPDPASRFQPLGVHRPSEVVDPTAFHWNDAGWQGRPLEELVIYELHVGTFTPEGTFDSAINRLDELCDLGVTAIELMPVAAFPGMRNWGYDGVDLFAPARAYGGPEALRRLVDAAHTKGLAVIMDVVYNHFGPDGNYLRQFSTSYFTDHHKTPWGDALNFDTEDSAQVRAFFIANACYWAHEYHIDGLRLDATHAIQDDSTPHILTELAVRTRESLPDERHFVLIAENERNDPRLISPPEAGGHGLDAVWADDFHHQVRVALTLESEGYYMDYTGAADDLVLTLRQGWFYTGQMSQFLGEARGASPGDLPPPRFVLCIQNHDQVGNRAMGDRLHHAINLAAYRAAAALLLLNPYTPLLWMGQEWAASTPFLYFTDHNPELGKLVTEGRRREFAGFSAFSGQEVPDPQAEETFLRSKLRWEERNAQPHAGVLALYRELLALRRTRPALRSYARETFAITALSPHAVAVSRLGSGADDALLIIINLRETLDLDLAAQAATIPPQGYDWSLLLDSEDTRYGGSGSTNLLRAPSGQARLLLDGPRAVVLGALAVSSG